MIEFFDLFPAKPTSLTLLFEENRSEKGWVVSLKRNKSEFGEIIILKSHGLRMKNPCFSVPSPSHGDVLFMY